MKKPIEPHAGFPQTGKPKKPRTRRSVRIFWSVFLGGLGLFFLIIVLALMGVFGRMPSLKQLENPSLLQSSEVYAADGTLMGKYYRERGNRSNVNYSDISPHVIHALVATEDVRFYSHSGIDWKRTGSAVATMGSSGGGSTVTQQLAKQLLGQGNKNVALRVIEKLKEYIIAVRLERNFTKEEILALYLNAVPYGDNVYGIRNAARTFFSKEPDRLDPNEAAVLVGMLKGNSIYNPRTHMVAAFNRKNVVLSQMEKAGYMKPAEAAALKSTPITLHYQKLDENTGYAPYFREVLKDELKDALKDLKNAEGDPYDIYDDGLKVYTTINTKMQQYAEEAVSSQMPMLQRTLNSQSNIRNGSVWKGHDNVLDAAMKASERWRNLKDEGLTEDQIRAAFKQAVPMKVFAWNMKREKDTVMTPIDSIKYHRQMMQTAFMVMDPITGEVKAWVGGISFKTWKYDHANIETKRQVGSSIKPFLYAQAMEERGFTPETPVEDVQQSFGKDQKVPATSKSCSGRTMSMASALAWSKNCATAYIMKQVGPEQFASFLSEKIHIPTKVEPFPSIALGSCDLSLYEMMWGYTVFPGHGYSTKPKLITRIEDRNGNVIKRIDMTADRKESISEVTAYNMTRLMEGPVTKGTAAGLMQALGAAEMGGKTGTTNDNADAWFMGYTPQLVAGVWVGCDDRFIRIESAQGFGGTAARPIWQNFFQKVYNDASLGIEKSRTFDKPADMDNSAYQGDVESIIPDSLENAEGQDMGAGSAQDYQLDTSSEYIPPESQKPVDDAPPADRPKRDSGKTVAPKIGEAAPPQEEKKGIFRRIFGGKKNKDKDKPENEY
ncbi:transglycosylase domain-containing protein [Flaviaesturariibacter aridisoli]|uniref:Penicillin-binding protein n=1 Tax=Flaviaesturariibacter aridisoli TaxID=2545761 RepID=A0A4R4E6X7_9BACT|nr:transglycosylase domain-containing protein [Flaviaesturariibacter aridisoli]TCZ74550.1 penicillin-binding protein [Flaviaesturariibacter aridisoli]